ncbi:hypothetical protein [Streptomyces canus]|uniref:hypothetical protein n=1 Tax=Streptomyces canus TaxID=58343 RepID=UPI0036EBCFB8
MPRCRSYIKPYARCRGSHPAIDTVLALVQERDLKPEDVRHISITAGETAVNTLPVDAIETVFDAQFSLTYAAPPPDRGARDQGAHRALDQRYRTRL